MAVNTDNSKKGKADNEVLAWVNVMIGDARVCAVPIKDVKFKTKVEEALLEFLGDDAEASLEAVITLRKPGSKLNVNDFKRVAV